MVSALKSFLKNMMVTEKLLSMRYSRKAFLRRGSTNQESSLDRIMSVYEKRGDALTTSDIPCLLQSNVQIIHYPVTIPFSPKTLSERS